MSPPYKGYKLISPSRSSDRKVRVYGHLQFAFCMLLHMLLVAAHIPLVVIGFNGHPLHLVKDRWYTESFFYSYSFGPNFIGKAYLVLLLWYTQKLALKRNLHKRQALTAIHDQATAWLGLGSSIPVLLDQFSTCVSPCYVVCIFLYLAGLFVLGLTMPILFSIGSVFEHQARYLNITNYMDAVGTNPSTITDAFPVVNILPLVGWDISTLGWKGDVIYDIPNFLAPLPVLVSAKRMQVRCKAIPNANQSGAFDTTSGTYPFGIDPRIENINVAPTNRAIYVLPLTMKTVTGTDLPSQQAPSTIIVASTFPIQDDILSRRYSVTNFDPPVSPDTCQFKTDCTSFSSLQLLACDKDFHTDNVHVIPQFGISSTSTNDSLTSGWNNWTLPAPPVDTALSLVNRFSTFAPLSNTVHKYHTVGLNFSGRYTFSTLETNLMDALRFDHEGNNEINLGQLETALQNAVAAVFWRGSVRMALEQQLPNDPPVQVSQVHEAPFRYSVQITFWPPIVGLTTSVILLVAAIILTRHAQPVSTEHDKLGTPGVLQLTWLLSDAEVYDRDSGEQQRIANLLKQRLDSRGDSSTTLKALREEGKKIKVEGWRHRNKTRKSDFRKDSRESSSSI